jgi:hypothetical protein
MSSDYRFRVELLKKVADILQSPKKEHWLTILGELGQSSDKVSMLAEEKQKTKTFFSKPVETKQLESFETSLNQVKSQILISVDEQMGSDAACKLASIFTKEKGRFETVITQQINNQYCNEK